MEKAILNDFDDLRRRAALVRDVPLKTVLMLRGAARDQHDKSKWHTEQGPLSVTGQKFTNWQRGAGGGGAIDLVMHLADLDFRRAVSWLEQHLAVGAVSVAITHSPCKQPPLAGGYHELRLPVPHDGMLGRVQQYLTGCRHLAASLLEPLFASGKLYADSQGNAVFLLVAGKANRPVGAELRGTGPRVWRGMAPGTRKDSGYFWIGTKGSNQIILCESAIDAISCFEMHRERICISTSGVRANPRWLGGLITRGYEVHCGFDTDEPGDAAATRMIALYPAVKRLRPPAHDWNDVLASGQ
jgi:hypothetical protein